MSFSELIGKALIVVKADTKQAIAEIKLLSDTEQKAAKTRIDAMKSSDEAMERSSQKFGLAAAAMGAGWAIVSSSVKKYEEHLKSLGESGEEELGRLNQLTGGLAKAQDSLQIAIAKVALAAAPAAELLGKMAGHLGAIVGLASNMLTMPRISFPGGGSLPSVSGDWLTFGLQAPELGRMALEAGEEFFDFGAYGGRRGRYGWERGGISGWAAGFEDRARAGERRILDVTGASSPTSLASWLPGVSTADEKLIFAAEGRRDAARLIVRDVRNKLENAVIGVAKGFDGEAVKPSAEAKEWAKQRAIYDAVWRDVLNPAIGATSGRSRGAAGTGALDQYGRSLTGDGLTDDELLGLADDAGRSGNFDQFGEYAPTSLADLDRRMAAARQIAAGRAHRESMLEAVFGPVEEFDLYRTAWMGLESAVTAGLSAWIDGSKSAGVAMKEALSGFAKQLAGEALLQALRHGAYAIGSLALGDPRAATQHGIAAAKWGAVALAAGTFAKATSGQPGAGGAGANAAAGIGLGVGAASQRPVNLTVVRGDAFASDSPRYVARRTRRDIDNARMFADYEGN